jgi:nitrile hydratase beta subunit
MDGVHDMGGMHGFGPIPIEQDEPVFHAWWEGQVYALGAAGGRFFPNIDASRHALEKLPPAEYLADSYYERWLRRMELRVVELGLITEAELSARQAEYEANPQRDVPRRSDPDVEARLEQRFQRQPALDQPDGTPSRFKVGDRVMTRNIHPAGHTRLPRYARQKRGVIHLVHGSHVFPDTNAHGLGPHPQGVYSVRFDASELWGDDAEGRGSVFIDLWDAYLEADSHDRKEKA